MKRLANSSRFWSTVIGTVASAILYHLFGDLTYALTVQGSFAAIVVTTAVKDSYSAYQHKDEYLKQTNQNGEIE